MQIERALALTLALGNLAQGAWAGPGGPASGTRSTDVPRDTAPAAGEDLPSRLPSITIYLYDVHQLLDGSFAMLAQETSAIFREMGVDVAWKNAGLGTTYGRGPSREVPIIVLREPPGGHRGKRDVLGLVPKEPPIAAWVFFENVRRAVGVPGHAVDSFEARGKLAVALGRVIAHEVVHTLAPRLQHTERGLMRHALDRDALTGPARPAFADCVEAVRAALAGAPRPPLPATASALSPRF